jgi:long-chain acyl-CoA synthetase
MREVRQVAAWIKAQNWPPGSRLVILSRNSAWWLMADFAVWMAGHVSIPLYPGAGAATLESLIRHCDPVACFVGPFNAAAGSNEDLFRNLPCITFPSFTGEMPPRVTRWEDIVRDQQPLQGFPVRNALETATIIYTSGTTGQPKGAMHTFQALSLMGKSMAPALENPPKDGDRMLSYLPLAHIAERAIVEMNALFTPLEVFFADTQETFLDDLKRARATLFFSVPRLYTRFQQKVFEAMPEKKLSRLLAIPVVGWLVRKKLLDRLGLSHARMVAGGGAATPPELIAWYRKLGLNFIEGYGMTETGITHVPLPGAYRLGFVGNASFCAHTRISMEGEVQIQGPMNMLGYFRSPELTREAMTEDGFFRTGDRGEIDAEGRLRLFGRLREEFKSSKGKYVIPSRIEMLLGSSTLIETAAVFGAGMTLPFALLVLTQDKREAAIEAEGRAAIDEELTALLRSVNGQLEPHEQLRFIAVCPTPWTVDNGLLTPTLKVRRVTLEKAYEARFGEWEKLKRTIVWLEGK